MEAPRLAVVVPVFGRHALTHSLVADIARESDLVAPIVVDNGGDYPPVGSETVLTQERNLGWLRGTNVGLRQALAGSFEAVVLLNNDTRLSRGFFAGLHAAARPGGVGIVGPRYDDHFAHQHDGHTGPAAEYPARRRTRLAAFVDGTCMYVKRQVLDEIGLLDEAAFGETGWGADIDLAVRARRAGWDVVVTSRAFLSHTTASTALVAHGGLDEYWRRGDADMRRGLAKKWGEGWEVATGLAPTPGLRGAARRLRNRALPPVSRSRRRTGA
ncbi:MAG: rhamnosyl transferase wbbL2 [Frankiales bacterium]|nr:rhamnosyl transferase wbbL2 [Frankiales bacterium]